MKKNKKRFIRHEQWIEIQEIDGKCVVLRYPSNAEFEKLRLEMDPPPHMIYRRLFMVKGVPSEYMWTGPTPEIQQYGGLFLQRITVDEWPLILALEQASGSDAVIPATNPQPRPEELGPCPCPRCTEEREKDLPSRFSRNRNN